MIWYEVIDRQRHWQATISEEEKSEICDEVAKSINDSFWYYLYKLNQIEQKMMNSGKEESVRPLSKMKNKIK